MWFSKSLSVHDILRRKSHNFDCSVTTCTCSLKTRSIVSVYFENAGAQNFFNAIQIAVAHLILRYVISLLSQGRSDYARGHAART